MKQTLKPLLLAGLAASIAACSMAPRYERPDIPVSAQVPAGDVTTAQFQAIAETGWHNFYQDPDLQQLLTAALANNRDLRVAALNVEQVQAQYRIQRAALLPSVGADATANRQRVPSAVSATGNDMISSQYSVGLGVAAWELDLFGRLGSLRQGALQQYLATTEARRSVQLSLAAQVGQSYYAWVANRQLLEFARDTLERQQASYAMVQRRHQQGVSSRLDLSQAASAVHSARVDIARYQQQLEQSLSALQVLVGAPIEPNLASEPVDLGAVAIAPVPALLSSRVLLQRPDVLQAEHALQAANAHIGAARAAFFPRISLTASAGSISNDLSGLFENGTSTWSFSPRVTLPLFTWGANKANLDVAELRRDASVAQYERAIQTAFKETLDSLQALQTFDAQLRAQQDLVEASERSLSLAKIRYEKGVDSFLEVLVSQRNFNAAQQALINVQLQQLNNRIALFRALGGGVADLDERVTNL